jgi:transcriptional/translational regulatory protein YebC/TACO1
MVASVMIPVTEEGTARNILKLLDALEDNDDVQEVFTNADFDDELLENLDI